MYEMWVKDGAVPLGQSQLGYDCAVLIAPRSHRQSFPRGACQFKWQCRPVRVENATGRNVDINNLFRDEYFCCSPTTYTWITEQSPAPNWGKGFVSLKPRRSA